MSATEDLATLGIEVKSGGVAEASSRLDTLVTKADKAVTATQNLERSWEKLGKVKLNPDTLTKSWEALGAKSTAMFDQMRTDALTAYTKIRLCSESTAQDIIRAERAKNSVIKQINEEQFGRQTTLLSKMKEHWVATTAAVTAAYMGIRKVSGFVEDSAKLGARYETLGVVMEVVGKNAGYSKNQLIGFSTALQTQGISMVESRQTLTQMAQAQLDLNKATELGRVAQDAAVIGQMNSSEAFQRMIYGIQSGQIEILRTIGINVNFEASYAKVAKATGRTVASFTEAEKATIRMNAVLDAGQKIAGTYEAAMGTAGKQMTSFTRYVEDFKVIFGSALLEGLTVDVEAATVAMKEMQKSMKDPETQKALSDLSKEVSDLVKDLAEDAPKALRATAEAFKRIIEIYQMLPDGAVGAGTFGIIGAAIFGGPTGLTIAFLYAANVQLHKLHENLKWIPDLSFTGFIDNVIETKNALNDMATWLDKTMWKLKDFIAEQKGINPIASNVLTISMGQIDKNLEAKNTAKITSALSRAELAKTQAGLYADIAEEDWARLKSIAEEAPNIFNESTYAAESVIAKIAGANNLLRAQLEDYVRYVEEAKTLKDARFRDDVTNIATTPATGTSTGTDKYKRDTIKLTKAQAQAYRNEFKSVYTDVAIDEVQAAQDAIDQKAKLYRAAGVNEIQIARWGEDQKKNIQAQVRAEDETFRNAQEEANKLRAIKEISTEQQAAIKNLEASRAQAEAAELADARKTMMEDFNNAQETYNFELELLEERRDRYAYLIKDQAAADIWYAKKKRALDNELAKSSDDFIAGGRAGYADLEEDLYSWGRAGADALRTFNDAGKSLVSDSLFSFMKGDMDSFSAYWDSFCDSMLRSFTDSVAQMVAEWAAGQAAMAASGAWGGVSGFFSGLFGSAHGNVFMNGSPVAFAAGGLITRPTIFPMAAGGLGLAGEAGTEAIMPLKRLGNGNLGVEASGGGVTVNVINNGSQAQASVQQSRTANGGLQLDVLIDDIVAGKIAKGKTRNALMQQTAGFRPNIVRR